MIAGLYVIRNNITKAIYIGHASNIKQRFRQHRNRLNKGTHANPHLQLSWNYHGATTFGFRILKRIAPLAERCAAEAIAISIAKRTGRPLYNVGDGGEGQKHTALSRAKISAAHSGKLKPYMAAINRERCTGKPSHPNTRLAAGRYWKGRKRRPLSAEHRKNLSTAMKDRPGRVWTIAQREKLRASMTGKKATASARRNMQTGRLRALASGQRSRIRLITFHGKTQSIKDWAIELGIKRQTLNWRLCRDWSIEAAFGISES